jgi:subtilisin family serine protease
VAPDCTSTEAAEKWLSPIIGDAKVHFAWSFSDFRGLSVSLTADQISLLRQESAVKHVEENCIVRLPYLERKGDLQTLQTAVAGLPGWGQYRSDQTATNWTNTVPFNPPSTAASTGTANARTVHILDTGVRTTHDEFKTPTGGASRVVTSVTFTTDGTADDNGHGTHVAGTCCGVNAGYDTWATLVSVKVLNKQGSGTTTGIINGINYVVNNKRTGTNLISMSLGGTGTSLNSAVTSAFNAGVNSIVAAGNGDALGRGIPANDTTPCNAIDSFCVASCNTNNQLSSFSNYGYYVDIIAPGENILSASYTADNAYTTMSGTSMATPAVTGVVSITAYVSPSKATTSNLRSTMTACSTKNIINNLSTKPQTVNYLLYDRC